MELLIVLLFSALRALRREYRKYESRISGDSGRQAAKCAKNGNDHYQKTDPFARSPSGEEDFFHKSSILDAGFEFLRLFIESRCSGIPFSAVYDDFCLQCCCFNALCACPTGGIGGGAVNDAGKKSGVLSQIVLAFRLMLLKRCP